MAIASVSAGPLSAKVETLPPRKTRSTGGRAPTGTERDDKFLPSSSDAQVTLKHARLGAKCFRATGPGDRAGVIEHDDLRGDVECQVDVLLSDENRKPGRAEAGQAVLDGVEHARRQALTRLIHDEQARVRHECATNRQHLLLATRQ